jgi:hypothetical protein
MAVVQLSWQDNANNETHFKIYQDTTSPISASSTQIAEVRLVSGIWVASETTTGSAPNISLDSTNSTDATEVGETFVVTFEESVAGDYYFGVSAGNSVGDSDIVTSSQLTIA